MQPFIFDLLNIAQLSTGRRVSLYTQWRRMLIARGLARILAYLERARAHDLITKALEQRWAAQARSGVYSAETHALDALVDQILAGMDLMVEGQMRGLPETDPVYQAGALFVDEVFPAGVAAITKLPYVEQVTVVENIVTKLATSLVGVVDTLNLTHMAARLADAFAKYRQAVDADSGRVAFAKVRDANRRGLAYVAELVFMILAEYHDSDDPAHMAARKELLAPLMLQDERARADWRVRRRGQPDVESDIEPGADDQPGESPEPEPGDDVLDAQLEQEILAEQNVQASSEATPATGASRPGA